MTREFDALCYDCGKEMKEEETFVCKNCIYEDWKKELRKQFRWKWAQ